MLERMSTALEHKLAIALKKIMKSESQYSKTHLVFKTPDAIPCLEQLMTWKSIFFVLQSWSSSKKIKSHCVSINQGELKIDWIISCHWQFHKCICSKENCRQCWWCPSWPSFTSCLVDNPKLESTFNIHTVRKLNFLSKNSTLISRENCQFFWGEKLVKMLWFWTF